MLSEKVNWLEIQSEYINGHISYRKLAEKHGISFNTLKDRAVADKWFEKKKEQHNKIEIKTQQKSADKLAEREANRLLRISNAADRLLAKIEEATEQLDQFIITNRVKQKEVEYEYGEAGYGKVKKETIKEGENRKVIKADHLDRAGLKQLTSALKDLRDIHFTQEEEKPQETPNISINIRAATPDDIESEEDEH